VPTSRVSRKPHLTLAALSAAALLVAACSSGSPSPQASTSGSGPVTLTNCGTEVTYPKQASRIVATSNSANIGTLIRIGAVQNLAAVSLQKGNDEVLSALYSPGIENVPRLQNPISMESIVSTEPDLLIGSSGDGSAGLRYHRVGKCYFSVIVINRPVGRYIKLWRNSGRTASLVIVGFTVFEQC